MLYTDASRTAEHAVLHSLRQQATRKDGRAALALADFVAPQASGIADYVGAFAVTAGHGLPETGRGGEGDARRLPRHPRSPRSPIAWPRRSPSDCTRRCAGCTGAMRRTSDLTTTT